MNTHRVPIHGYDYYSNDREGYYQDHSGTLSERRWKGWPDSAIQTQAAESHAFIDAWHRMPYGERNPYYNNNIMAFKFHWHFIGFAEKELKERQRGKEQQWLRTIKQRRAELAADTDAAVDVIVKDYQARERQRLGLEEDTSWKEDPVVLTALENVRNPQFRQQIDDFNARLKKSMSRG